MKKYLLFAALVVYVFGANIPTPPSMPSLMQPKKVDKKDSCQIIPPMLIHIPPMLEDDLDRCKNRLYLPTKDMASKRLKEMLKRDVKVKNVSYVEGFSMLYKIETDNGVFYCNRKLDRCLAFNIEMVMKKDLKKVK